MIYLFIYETHWEGVGVFYSHSRLGKRIQGKGEQSREKISAFPYTSVCTIAIYTNMRNVHGTFITYIHRT